MLSPASWLPRAKLLRLGERKRTDHDCGPGRTLTIENSPDGLRAWCFRCNDKGWEPPPQVSVAERLARLRSQAAWDEQYAQCVDLPGPMVRVWDEWPDRAKFWLIKAGLTRADLPGLGCYYHPPTDRVVLPVLSPSGSTVFWQARALDGRQPKYLAPGIGKKDAVPKYGKADMVTLTEDILSAYKVGLVAEGWALLGTSISNACLAEMVNRGQPVNLWLDPDAGGDRGRAKIAPAIRGTGLRVNIIYSKRDPKMMTRHEIRNLLGINHGI